MAWWAANAETFRLRLRELRGPTNELLGEATAKAHRQGIEEVVRDRGYVPEEYLLKFAVHDNYYAHVWASSPVMPLTDWLRGNQRSREWMEKLAKQLNSGEDTDVAQGDFF